MRRKTAGIVALVAVLATTALVVALTRNASAGAGPFCECDDNYNTFGLPAKPGQVFATYWELLRALPKPVVLLGMRPLHPQDARGVALRYGAIAVPTVQYSGRMGWKPKAWHMRPLAGFVLPAHHRGTLVIGSSSTQPGVHHVHSFVLDYRIGGTTYSTPLQFEIDVCVGYRFCPASR